uniref:Alternative protein TREX1 n=1 Tax=Homo sapiens TaxID=9606 RepID=L8E8B0_HUMAN|nr:alternative protein TREX1 [Homo sapiens]
MGSPLQTRTRLRVMSWPCSASVSGDHRPCCGGWMLTPGLSAPSGPCMGSQPLLGPSQDHLLSQPLHTWPQPGTLVPALERAGVPRIFLQ